MNSPGIERQERVRHALAQRMGSVAVICEAVRRRHNTSAILRSAECFGVHEVHLVTDRFHVSKGAARGSERWLEVHVHDTAGPAIRTLQERGFRVYAAHPREDSQPVDTIPVDTPVAVLMGSELTGVSEEALALVDGTVTIEMRGLTESLNVSAAAACLIHRLAERRRALVGADLEPERQEAFFDRWFEAEEMAARGRRRRQRRGPLMS